WDLQSTARETESSRPPSHMLVTTGSERRPVAKQPRSGQRVGGDLRSAARRILLGRDVRLGRRVVEVLLALLDPRQPQRGVASTDRRLGVAALAQPALRGSEKEGFVVLLQRPAVRQLDVEVALAVRR